MTGYVFDNAAGHAAGRFAALEACLDPVTTRHLAAIGVGPGWSCLEVGAGGGSIGRWLSAQVGSSGNVLATDIDPRWVDGRGAANLEIRRHDVVHDDLPEWAFDLVHARLVLVHLPERQQVLRRLIRALRPGGWILLEEFDLENPIAIVGDPPAEEQFRRSYDTMARVLRRAGVDYEWGRSLFSVLGDSKLVDVGAEGSFRMWSGGSPWTDVFLANVDQLEEKMVATGDVTRSDLDDFRSVLNDPGVAFSSHLAISAWGRRPPP